MSQRTKGLYKLTQLSKFYVNFQGLLGAPGGIRKLALDYVLPRKPSRVLDLGCGPAKILQHIPDAHYTGIDSNPDHIEAAKAEFGERGEFICGDFAEVGDSTDGTFDVALCFGFFHHLDDQRVVEICELVSGFLGDGGWMIAVDPTFIDRQHPVARAMAKADSGKHVRRPAQYEALARSVFGDVSVEVRHDILRIPYNHCVTIAQKPS
ncbi:MAG: SAM-dependent methyltransferase [Bradymonadia bacterium]|jgi:SAM-dependent methyltransferase